MSDPSGCRFKQIYRCSCISHTPVRKLGTTDLRFLCPIRADYVIIHCEGMKVGLPISQRRPCIPPFSIVLGLPDCFTLLPECVQLDDQVGLLEFIRC